MCSSVSVQKWLYLTLEPDTERNAREREKRREVSVKFLSWKISGIFRDKVVFA